MKTLILDIETSPNIAHVWGLFNQNVGLSQLMSATEVICFGAKWHGSEDRLFFSDFHDGHTEMIRAAYYLLADADVVVHYNGQSFDIPHLMREFLLLGFTPPAPFQQIDLYRVIKKKFRFVSNKLDHVASELELGSKVKHAGHTLWVRCMNNDPEAWEEMKTYNLQDVDLTEDLLDRIRPWIDNGPNSNLYDPQIEDTCSSCGSTDLERRGFSYTTLGKYQRYYCRDCGAWSKSGRSEIRTDLRGTA
jgi:hypothetical protein